MAGSPEQGKVNKYSIRALLLIGIFILVGLCSCNSGKVLIVSDPYTETVSGGHWKPSSVFFSLRAGWKGYRVYRITISDENELEELLKDSSGTAGAWIVSPLTAQWLPASAAEDRRIIIAGGYPPRSVGNLEYVVPDRLESMMELGNLAAESTDEMVLALFNTTTEARIREKTVFIETFRKSSGSPESINIVNLSDNPGQGIPEEFFAASENAGLLVLLAGPENLAAFLGTEDAGNPVITEYSRISGARQGRIIASVEENQRAMTVALLRQLDGKDILEQKSYPTRVYIY